jgi:molybdenum cofactor biosynthesis protein B
MTKLAHGNQASIFEPLHIAILTVSDTRDEKTDTSGALLKQRVQAAGHHVATQAICIDDRYQFRALVSQWIADTQIQIVLTTGGTGITNRDCTIEAIMPLYDKCITGFGELFRQLSLPDIGLAAIQSRAVAGIANGTLIICLPGSTAACRLAWDQILQQQLDNRTRPCNFAQLLPKTGQ